MANAHWLIPVQECFAVLVLTPNLVFSLQLVLAAMEAYTEFRVLSAKPSEVASKIAPAGGIEPAQNAPEVDGPKDIGATYGYN
jgi:hypothetical protein